MSEKIFKERFCEITKIKVCTTTAELNFDTYTEPGVYEIYEDMGSGRSRIYLLAVDKSATGACVKQTRIYCGIVEARQANSSGAWTAWQKVTGGSGGTIDINLENGEGEVSLKQVAWKEEASNLATGKGAVALGGYNRANGKCSMAVNYNNEVNAPNAFAANSGNKIHEEAEGSFVSGHHNEAKSTYQTVVGTYSVVDANDSFVVGNGSSETDRRNAFKVTKHGNVEASGKVNAVGDIKTNGNVEATKANVTGVNATNISVTNNLSVSNKVTSKEIEVKEKATFGSGVVTPKNSNYGGNTVTGSGSAAFGGNNKVYADTSVAFLTSNTIPEGLTQVFIAGHANVGAASHQAIFGTYADPRASDAFVIGNGNSAGRKNAFAVKKNGDAEVQGKLHAANVETSLLTIGNVQITEDLGVVTIPAKIFANDFSALNNIDATDVLAMNIRAISTLTIGSTTITEEQLKKLLALIDEA